MTALNRKAFRDLLAMKTQAIAIALVIAAGVATFVMSLSTIRSLQQARDTFYDQHRFPHVFVHVKRAPVSLAQRIAEIPDVAATETRIATDVRIEISGQAEPAMARLISLAENREPILNKLYLRSGRGLSGARGEVIVNEAFAQANSLVLGTELRAIINGRRERLKIVGTALSPEFVYTIRPGDIWPDDTHYGVLWMSESELAAACDLKGAFNDLSLTVVRLSAIPEILKRVDRLTHVYGGLGAYDRSEQTSHRLVSDEMTQLRAMSLIPPTIFLFVAAFLLNVVISRLVKTQREQIAVLKAFGYTPRQAAWHYAKVVGSITLLGILIGSLAGIYFGKGLTGLYMRFFRFPEVHFSVSPEVLFAAGSITILAALLGVFAAIRHATRLPPAEAMKPESPDTYGRLFVERFGLQRIFGQTTRMIFRRLEHRPLRTLLSCIGIALAIAILVLGTFSENIVDYVNDYQFYTARRYDMNVMFIDPVSSSALHELQQLPGVLRAEPFRSVSARLRAGHRSRRVSVLGIDSDSHLFRIMNLNGRAVDLPPNGLIITSKLAELLAVRASDSVTVETLEGKRLVYTATIHDVVDEFAGAGVAYISRDAVNRLMQEAPVLSGAFLSIDSALQQNTYRSIREVPRVAGVTSQKAAKQTFEKLMSENLLRMRLFNVGFAAIIAFGVVYNTARISLSELGRDLATLRVIGLTRGEVSRILIGELGALTLAAIPLGLALGWVFSGFAVKALETESQRFPLIIAPATYAFAATVVCAAATLSALVVRRRLDHLDMVTVLKTRE